MTRLTEVFVEARDGKLTFHKGRRFMPSLGLYFPKPIELNKMFSGKKAFVLPLIGGFKFAMALKNFKALMARLQYYMSGAPEVKDNHKVFLAKMLTYATAFGISEVANCDPYVASNVAHMPDGVVEVFVQSEQTVAAHMCSRATGLHTRAGLERSQLQLIFQDVKVAIAS
jgi:hypothetical protein